MVCDKTGHMKEFMLESMAKFSYDSEPCKLPPPFESTELQEIASRNEKYAKDVQNMEDILFWNGMSKRAHIELYDIKLISASFLKLLLH